MMIYIFESLIGIEAVSTHGDKDQEERNKAVQEFRAFKKDVLVATDVASKGRMYSILSFFKDLSQMENEFILVKIYFFV